MPELDPDSDRPLGDTLATPPATRINARGLLTEVLHIDAKLDAYKTRRAELRGLLETEALARYEAEGAAPSWKVARLGSATLCAADADPVVNVTDDDAYAEWVLNNHPTEAEVVLRIPGPLADADQVRELVAVLTTIGCRVDIEPAAAFLAAIEKTGRADTEAGILIDKSGEIVPGVTVTKKAPYLRVTLDAEAKARARAQIDDVLDAGGAGDLQGYTDTAAAELVSTLAALSPRDEQADDDEGAGDAPPPDEGPEHVTTIEVGDPGLEQVDVEP